MLLLVFAFLYISFTKKLDRLSYSFVQFVQTREFFISLASNLFESPVNSLMHIEALSYRLKNVLSTRSNSLPRPDSSVLGLQPLNVEEKRNIEFTEKKMFCSVYHILHAYIAILDYILGRTMNLHGMIGCRKIL